MPSVLLDTAGDALASAAVAISGAVIYLTGRFYWLDSLLSLVIGTLVGPAPAAGGRARPPARHPARPR